MEACLECEKLKATLRASLAENETLHITYKNIMQKVTELEKERDRAEWRAKVDSDIADKACAREQKLRDGLEEIKAGYHCNIQECMNIAKHYLKEAKALEETSEEGK